MFCLENYFGENEAFEGTNIVKFSSLNKFKNKKNISGNHNFLGRLVLEVFFPSVL